MAIHYQNCFLEICTFKNGLILGVIRLADTASNEQQCARLVMKNHPGAVGCIYYPSTRICYAGCYTVTSDSITDGRYCIFSEGKHST